MEPREPKSMESLLPRLLARLAQESGKARTLGPVWAHTVGPHIARHSSPHALEKQTLVVTVASAEWAHTLSQQAASLCERLNERLGPDTVTELVFRLEDR
ncbi:DUF721 domain-containing protein [Myxococcaceae bacterium GXIMD 01537]